ncbi:DUF4178 domain-containing protein [Roseicyclus persicicus]|uniref:DUF4178 domain-containing protein n=1 Tax=Roseicyclus persicicus TaxID=2650661 RepID=A0A7X6GX99_9RHOB|nr:DUF4178 domain-containing protein [Roseibacterium persicicum]NKX43238.1 DUF4178 domain-containing protein [Roseibacterium persicicum]
MTRAAGLSSINCTQCGAGLSVLGGGRVMTQVCGYCGSVLDAQDNYRILDSIGKRDHPDSPVHIGMTLPVQGVDFVVIGTLGKVERWQGRSWRWVEHQLFSPTHGYAWLTWEGESFTFTRKIRDYGIGNGVTPAGVEVSETPPVRVYRGERYKYYETSTAEIDFMEGEFNWLPRIGETTTTVVLLGPKAMLGFRAGESEAEVELTTLLPREETARALGATLPPGRPPRHPLTPYRPLREEAFMRLAFAASAVVALVMALVLALSGAQVFNQSGIPITQLPARYAVPITNTAQLAQLRVRADLDNAWAVFGAEVRGPDGAVIFAGEGVAERYSGVDGGESWSEGNSTAALTFRPRAAGMHEVTVMRGQEQTVGPFGYGPQRVAISVHEGRSAVAWLIGAAILFGIGWIGLTGRRAIHEKLRFAGGDWHEE